MSMSSAFFLGFFAAEALRGRAEIASAAASARAHNFFSFIVSLLYQSTKVSVPHRLGFSSTLYMAGVRSLPVRLAEDCIRRL